MSKATLKALSDSTFTTNGVRGITAAAHRNFNNTSIDSMYVNPGSVLAWAGLVANIPDGWKICNGALLSQTDYSALFTALGGSLSPWGVQTTTFSLPNIPTYGSPVQAFPTNENVSNGAYKLGLTGGEKDHILTSSEMPNHSHNLSIPLYSEGGATNRIANAGTTAEGTTFTGVTGSTGGGSSHNNMQPFVAMYWIIKTV